MTHGFNRVKNKKFGLYQPVGSATRNSDYYKPKSEGTGSRQGTPDSDTLSMFAPTKSTAILNSSATSATSSF